MTRPHPLRRSRVRRLQFLLALLACSVAAYAWVMLRGSSPTDEAAELAAATALEEVWKPGATTPAADAGTGDSTGQAASENAADGAPGTAPGASTEPTTEAGAHEAPPPAGGSAPEAQASGSPAPEASPGRPPVDPKLLQAARDRVSRALDGAGKVDLKAAREYERQLGKEPLTPELREAMNSIELERYSADLRLLFLASERHADSEQTADLLRITFSRMLQDPQAAIRSIDQALQSVPESAFPLSRAAAAELRKRLEAAIPPAQAGKGP